MSARLDSIWSCCIPAFIADLFVLYLWGDKNTRHPLWRYPLPWGTEGVVKAVG